jgi:hypothetical protein
MDSFHDTDSKKQKNKKDIKDIKDIIDIKDIKDVKDIKEVKDLEENIYNNKISLTQKHEEIRDNNINTNFIPKKCSLNKGRWTKEEHLKFINASLEHGNNWKKVLNKL